MSSATSTVSGRLREFFALDDDWERPGPTRRQRRNDFWIALAMWAWGSFGLELSRSYSSPEDFAHPWWMQHGLIALGCVILIWRRTHPLLVTSALVMHMLVTGELIAEVGYNFTMQCVYVYALFSGAAWARSRRRMAAVLSALMLCLLGVVLWTWLLGPSGQDFADRTQGSPRGGGILPPLAALMVSDIIVNLVYCAGGIAGGQASWLQARSEARMRVASDKIARQAEALADRKVVEERLRISRELHDVVAHHVSVMGVQAAAARRVLDKHPDAAATALAHVEESSRQAVGEMRGLLGTLRRTVGPQESPDDRAPQPGAGQIPDLVHQASQHGLTVTYDVVEDRPGALAEIPMPIGLSLYRTVQEALVNVQRHSTARQATVVLRFLDEEGRRYVEAEVLDDGRSRGNTSGSGLGLLGMRERIASHGGTSEIGPRVTGGFRVRVRFPVLTDRPPAGPEPAG